MRVKNSQASLPVSYS